MRYISDGGHLYTAKRAHTDIFHMYIFIRKSDSALRSPRIESLAIRNPYSSSGGFRECVCVFVLCNGRH